MDDEVLHRMVFWRAGLTFATTARGQAQGAGALRGRGARHNHSVSDIGGPLLCAAALMRPPPQYPGPRYGQGADAAAADRNLHGGA